MPAPPHEPEAHDDSQWHARVVAAMRSPDFYGVDSSVELRATHISYVFLAGDRAYKLKKPLVLPYLDYGSRERRRFFCHEEVRLNRRLAPRIYLGVRAVVRQGGGFAFSAAEDPEAVEHVVEMRRFRERDTLASRLDSGTAVTADADSLARLLAAFHSERPPPSPVPDWPGHLLRALSESLRDIAALGNSGHARAAAGLRRFADSFEAAHGELLERRGSRVRDGHGDLRAEHVVLEEPLQIVDCVEFDPHLRLRDAASDLAFLLMDLEASGHPGVARQLMIEYERAGGDAGPPQLRSFYELERALVRVKVALLRAHQQSDDPGGRQEAEEQAGTLLALARRLAWDARRPLVLVVCGLSGSGKSYLCEALAGVSSLPVLNSDVVRKEIAGLPPTARAGAEYYSGAFNRRTYVELGRRARAELETGGAAVVDATFRHAADRAAFLHTLGDAPQPLWVLCTAPAHVLRERVSQRASTPGAVSDADLRVLAQQRFEPLDEVPAERQLRLRTDRAVEELLDELEAWLD